MWSRSPRATRATTARESYEESQHRVPRRAHGRDANAMRTRPDARGVDCGARAARATTTRVRATRARGRATDRAVVI